MCSRRIFVRLRTAVYDGHRGFTLSHFHRGEELAEEMRSAGLTDVAVFGIEGPAWSMVTAVEQSPGPGSSNELFEAVLTATRMAEPYPEPSQRLRTFWQWGRLLREGRTLPPDCPAPIFEARGMAWDLFFTRPKARPVTAMAPWTCRLSTPSLIAKP
ncbi:hypothetical protein GCM10018779_62560 [Streptomyces griseocarneus]|nr:hypothetical protein GCM10018779_62560 [Streptomyces griseocarneus]